MSKIMIKEFIKKNILDKNNKVSSPRITENWFYTNNYINDYNTILQLTDFLPEESSFSSRIYCIMNDITNTPICVECQIQNSIFIAYTKGYRLYCSIKCSNKSNITQEKRKTTNIEKYGASNPLKNELIKERIKVTNIEKYGAANPFQSKEIQERIKVTNLVKYGAENPSQCKEIREKIKVNNLVKYGVEHYSQSSNFLFSLEEKFGREYSRLRDKNWLESELQTKSVATIAKELGCSCTAIHIWARKYEIQYKSIFNEQNEILEYIKSLGISSIEYDTRQIITPKELDIYLPDYNLAIELNGMYWHKEDKTKHLNKLNLCRSKDIRLLQFWDYQWNDKREICKSIIKSILNLNATVHARKCKIVELDSKTYKNFINENHMQSSCGASIRYGLTYNNELVSVIGFSKPRYNKNYDWELIRYANKIDNTVVGGFTKLLKHSRLTNIISYCDLMLFTGRIYKTSGFTQLKDSKPGYTYFKENEIRSREYFQKHKLETNLKNYDSNLTANENILNNGWYKIYDCGNGIWEYHR